MHSLGDALGTGDRDVHLVALVVLHGASQVPTIDVVGRPYAPLVWCFVHQDLCSRRGEGRSIKANGAV